MTANDSDWLYPEREVVDVTADTERPAAAHVWRCDDEGAEPTQHATLIEATGEPPCSLEAQVYGSGALLAQAAEDIAMWTFTEAGMRRLSMEANGVIARVA